MASKNGRWTSMFKSKPCSTHHQWQLDRNTLSGVDAEEKTPDPKPRWNPKAEQIRILEGIFNSGIVNPPRDEIKRIRVQLQEYGQVGDANVFYWFQNRKSRNKHKIKQLRSRQSINCPTKINHTTTTTASASVPAGVSNSPTKSVNNKTPHTDLPDLPSDLLFQSKSPFEFKSSNVKHSRPWNQQTVVSRQQNQQEEFMLTGIYEHDNNIQNAAVASKEKNHSYQTTPVNTIVAPSITATTTTTSATTQDPFNGLLQGMPEETSTYVDVAEDNLTQTKRVHGIRGISRNRDSRVTVLINEVEFEVGAGHFNVREAFGTGAVLFHSSGLPVLLNDWGFTLHPLQQGTSYFLV